MVLIQTAQGWLIPMEREAAAYIMAAAEHYDAIVFWNGCNDAWLPLMFPRHLAPRRLN